jgi:hypothetical protein
MGISGSALILTLLIYGLRLVPITSLFLPAISFIGASIATFNEPEGAGMACSLLGV